RRSGSSAGVSAGQGRRDADVDQLDGGGRVRVAIARRMAVLEQLAQSRAAGVQRGVDAQLVGLPSVAQVKARFDVRSGKVRERTAGQGGGLHGGIATLELLLREH